MGKATETKIDGNSAWGLVTSGTHDRPTVTDTNENHQNGTSKLVSNIYQVGKKLEYGLGDHFG